MRKFGLRLFLIRKLIESLMWSCIDEYTEYEEVADRLAKAHPAMERKRKPEPVARSVDSNGMTDGTIDANVEVCKRIIKHGDCRGCLSVFCGVDGDGESIRCHQSMAKHKSDWWKCSQPVESAHRWLAEHGIKE